MESARVTSCVHSSSQYRARLLERGVAGVLEPASHRNRHVGRVAAVGVGMELDVGSDRLAHGWNDRFAPSRRRVAIASARRAEPDLERFAPESITELRQSRALVDGADVAAHARSVRGQRPHRPAEQSRHRLAGDLPVEIPKRGVDPGERAAEERPRKLQLRIDHGVVDRVDLADVAPDHLPRDQPMQHLRGDVGLVRRNLSPPGLPVARGDAHERERLALEGLDRLHGQTAWDDRPVAIARRATQVVVAAGARSRGLRR